MSPWGTLLRYLRLCGVPFHAGTTECLAIGTTQEEAAELANPVRVIVTPITLDQRPWLAVTCEGTVVRPQLVQRSFGGRDVASIHDEDLSMLFPGCEVSAIPPLGNLFGMPVMVDESIFQAPSLSFQAYKNDLSVTVRTADLRRLAKPVIAEISVPTRNEVVSS